MTEPSGPASAVTTTARSSLARTERIAERWPRSANCFADDPCVSRASLSCTTSVCAATYARRRVGLSEVDRFTTESGSVLLKPCVHSRACVGRGGVRVRVSDAGEGRRRRRLRDRPKEAHSFSSRATIDRPREGGVDGGRTIACAIVRAVAVAAPVDLSRRRRVPVRVAPPAIAGLSSPRQTDGERSLV